MDTSEHKSTTHTDQHKDIYKQIDIIDITITVL